MAREKGSATGEKLGSRSARATQRREAERPGRKEDEEGEARERRVGERAGVERASKSRQRGGEARLLGRRGETGDERGFRQAARGVLVTRRMRRWLRARARTSPTFVQASVGGPGVQTRVKSSAAPRASVENAIRLCVNPFSAALSRWREAATSGRCLGVDTAPPPGAFQKASFKTARSSAESRALPGVCAAGLEDPRSSFFPHLWKRFGRHFTRF